MTLRDKMLAVIADTNDSVAEREELVEMRVMYSMNSSAVLESMTISLYGWHSMAHKRISF